MILSNSEIGGPSHLLVTLFVVFGVLGAGLRAVSAQSTHAEGGMYLFHHQPLRPANGEPTTEVYAAYGSVRLEEGPWSVFAELRARDTKLRSFFPASVWIQEAWAAYTSERSASEAKNRPENRWSVRAGKIYRRSGRFWDGSFFGNVHYFHGLKLNPQFGLETTGRFESGGIEWRGRSQFLLDSDRISGALPDRDFETLSRFDERLGWSVRGTAEGNRGFRLGATFLRERVVDRRSTVSEIRHLPHLAIDLAWSDGDVNVYLEGMRRWSDRAVPAEQRARIGSDARFALAGAQWSVGRFMLRYNYSRVEHLGAEMTEWIHQPGFTARFSDHVSGLVEWTFWEDTSRTEAEGPIDHSLSFVLHLRF